MKLDWSPYSDNTYKAKGTIYSFLIEILSQKSCRLTLFRDGTVLIKKLKCGLKKAEELAQEIEIEVDNMTLAQFADFPRVYNATSGGNTITFFEAIGRPDNPMPIIRRNK
jgi:hypothetical protein